MYIQDILGFDQDLCPVERKDHLSMAQYVKIYYFLQSAILFVSQRHFSVINVHVFGMYSITNTCVYRICQVLIKVCTQLREMTIFLWPQM